MTGGYDPGSSDDDESVAGSLDDAGNEISIASMIAMATSTGTMADGAEVDEDHQTAVLIAGVRQAIERIVALPPTPTPASRNDAARDVGVTHSTGEQSAARLAALRDRALRRARKGQAGESVERPIVDISLTSIQATMVENIRLTEDEADFSALRESLSTDGQLHPIVVVEDRVREGRFQLVAGFRRFRAASDLGWQTVKAIVFPATTAEAELYIVNAVENAQRFKLSDYEIASHACLMSARFSISVAEYSKRIGRRPARIQNLVRYLETLPADIREAWRSGDRLLNDHMLQKLASMPHDEASAYWEHWRARHTAAELAARGQARPRRSENRPTSATLCRLWLKVKRSETLALEVRDIVLQVVEFCQGQAASVPGLFDPRRHAERSGRRPYRSSKRPIRESNELPLAPFGGPDHDVDSE